YQEAVQLQSFPIAEARVISSAPVPGGPSHPKRSVILALSLLLGGAIGAALGLLRELPGRALRTEEPARDPPRGEFLGMLPLVTNQRRQRRRWQRLLARDPAPAARAAEWRLLPPSPDIMRYAIEHPLSSYAEVLRGVKLAADLTLGRTPRIIAAVS